MLSHKKIGLFIFVGLSLGIWKAFLSPEKIKTKLPFQLIYQVTVVGGKATGPLPMLILLHGAGGRESDWVERFKVAAQPIRIVSFRGPASKTLGYNWAPDTQAETAELAEKAHYDFMKKSAESVAKALPELTRKYPTKGKPFLAGFSSGGMLSYFIALKYPIGFSTIFPVSGELPPLLTESLTHPSGLTTKVVAFHGKNDQVFSIVSAKNAIEQIQTAGLSGALVEHEGGHEFSPDVVLNILSLIYKN